MAVTVRVSREESDNELDELANGAVEGISFNECIMDNLCDAEPAHEMQAFKCVGSVSIRPWFWFTLS